MVLAYITCKDEKEAEKISMNLLKKRLIVCANILPIKSIYRWKGKIVDERESVIIAKTIAKRYKELEKEVMKIHTYEVPCILRINSNSNKQYELWVKKEVG